MLQVEVRVKGRIAKDWSEWFAGLTIAHVEEDTILTGAIADQSALYGLLAKLRDLGLPLVSVIPATGLEPSSPPSDLATGPSPSNQYTK